MKIALAQLNYHVGDFTANTGKIVDSIRRAKFLNANLVVFSELSVCGYPALDFLDYNYFIKCCNDALTAIASECVGITAIVGAPSANADPKGKNLFNSAFVLADGKVAAIRNKTLLPTYDVFDEYRWFESNRDFSCVDINGVKVALTVCEDLWNMNDDPLYTSYPMEELIREKPSIMINLAASPFHYLHADERRNILLKNVKEYNLPLIYVNQTGAQTDLIFDGGSMVVNANAEVMHELSYFAEDFAICDFNESNGSIIMSTVDHVSADSGDKLSRIHDALVLGIRDYFQKMGFKKAILGLSGGIDSAVVNVLAVEALGKENVHAVMMPSEFSSDHSVSDSEKLIANLGCSGELLSIAPLYNAYMSSLENDFKGTAFNVAEENIQSRIRGTLVMALSNKFGYILLNTSNKSELAVGYGTLYGDMCGGLSVIGDLYKVEVYALARYINRDKEIIPLNIIDKAPSAELRPGQKDADSLPEYDVLDAVLFKYIEEANGPDKIIEAGFDAALVHRILRMVNNNEWKRFQFAPIIRVSPKSFGRGRRMPLVAKYTG